MECSAKNEDGSMSVDGNDLKRVDCFKCLVSRITSADNILHKARMRICCMNENGTTSGILCDKRPIRLKSKIYRKVMRPVAICGTECWATTTATRQRAHHEDTDAKMVNAVRLKHKVEMKS